MVPPLKVLSVEDGKIPTKKVKVRVKSSHLAVGYSCPNLVMPKMEELISRPFVGQI